MRKLFTLIAAAFMAVSAMATTIKDFEKTSFTSIGWTADVVKETYNFNADGTVTFSNESCCTNNYDYQYWLTSGIPLTEGNEYTITIEAKFDGSWQGEKDNTLICKVGDWGYGETKYLSPETDGEFHVISTTFTAKGNSNGIFLQHGHFVGNVTWKSIKITHEEADGGNHALKISTTEAKANGWDSQVTIAMNVPLETSKTYTLNMKIKGSNEVVGSQGQYGWVALQPVFNTADGKNAKYCANFCLATEWTSVCTSDGGSIENAGPGENATLTFNLGNLAGDLYIDDLTITEKESKEVVYSNDFESGLDGISKPSWHGHVTIARVALEETVPATPPVTTIITMPEAGYRTMGVGAVGFYPADGMKAYAAKVSEDKTKVKLTELSSVTSYAAVVLQGNPGAYLCIGGAPWANLSAINDLKFDWGNKTITNGDNIYILAKQNDNVVFAPASAGTLAARKGYLQIEGASAKALEITFDDEATEIKGITTVTNSSAAYNLAGQRVNANAKGIVIKNGKKYVNK